MDGKGTKRLVSITMQKMLVKNGGIMLVDEIEQGLEPDRIQNVARNLSTIEDGQIFISTHSKDVIQEIEACSIFVVMT